MSDNVEFSKYSSLMNHTNSKTIKAISNMGLSSPDVVWVATEKVHGANFGFWFNQEEGIKLSSRNNFVNDSFMSAWKLDKYHGCVEETFHNLVKENICSSEDTIVIYGEIFGGTFFGDKEFDSITVQKEVQYTPSTEFLAFDIKVIPNKNNEKEEFYLSFYDMDLLLGTKFNITPIISIGTFENVINLSNEFNSKIPRIFGIDTLGRDNICEGLVIRPLKKDHNLPNGKRVIIKSKNNKFCENKGKHKLPKLPKEVIFLSDLSIEYHEHLSTYITKERLSNVCSHLHQDEVDFNNFKSLCGKLFKDAYEEFDTNISDIIGKSQWKEISRSLLNISGDVVREYLLENK